MKHVLGFSVRWLAVLVMIGGILLNSMGAVAEATALPSAPQPAQSAAGANGGQNQPVTPVHRSKSAKTKIAVGFVLLGVGVLTIAATATLDTSGFKPGGAKTPALYAAGAGAAGVGVTLIAIGFHRRRSQ